MSTRRPIVVAVATAALVAMLGGSMTDTGPWYRELQKSRLNPPDWVFAPAWTLIYALAVVSAVLGYRALRSWSEQAWLIS